LALIKWFYFYFFHVLGGALQLTNMYGDTYLSEFATPKYADSFVAKYSTIIMSISQVSKPYFDSHFLKRFGIKQVMLSMFAWVLRFGLLLMVTPAMVYG
jgi:NHS family xanthosine MFS transporter